MARSIPVRQKKRGRPATGHDPLVALRLPPELIKTIDAWAKRNGATRSAAMRALIERGLAKD